MIEAYFLDYFKHQERWKWRKTSGENVNKKIWNHMLETCPAVERTEGRDYHVEKKKLYQTKSLVSICMVGKVLLLHIKYLFLYLNCEL